MKEYDIYVPGTRHDGAPVAGAVIEQIKASLTYAFGGCTHLKHRCEGEWRVGGVVFRDELTIIRVLDDGSTTFDMNEFKRNLKTVLQQDEVLVVRREVSIVE